ncbi:MAG: biotin-dependent carboxyltransferase family protein [Fimbriimonadales bacterium]
MSSRIDRLMGLASLQGPCVTGYRRFGVPPGGAFDQESFRLANALLGNEPGALAIELSNASIEIAFSATTRVAVVGAPVRTEVSGTLAVSNSAFDVPAGSNFQVHAPRHGLRAYICVAGGWIPSGIDSALGRSGRHLSVGDVLQHGETTPTGAIQRLADLPSSLAQGPFRVLKGPQSGFAGQPIRLASGRVLPLRVSNDSDRTGIRLDGLSPQELPKIDSETTVRALGNARHDKFPELPSEPACVGAIQSTPSGQLIVIGPDGPTIGGYPKIAVVCSADLDRLAHLRPGQEVELATIDLGVADALAAARELTIVNTVRQIQIARG